LEFYLKLSYAYSDIQRKTHHFKKVNAVYLTGLSITDFMSGFVNLIQLRRL